MKDTKLENNIRYYNLRKLAEAKRRAETEDKVLEEYDRLGGKFEIAEAEKPKKKAAKKATKKKAG